MHLHVVVVGIDSLDRGQLAPGHPVLVQDATVHILKLLLEEIQYSMNVIVLNLASEAALNVLSKRLKKIRAIKALTFNFLDVKSGAFV